MYGNVGHSSRLWCLWWCARWSIIRNMVVIALLEWATSCAVRWFQRFRQPMSHTTACCTSRAPCIYQKGPPLTGDQNCCVTSGGWPKSGNTLSPHVPPCMCLSLRSSLSIYTESTAPDNDYTVMGCMWEDYAPYLCRNRAPYPSWNWLSFISSTEPRSISMPELCSICMPKLRSILMTELRSVV